MTSSYGWAVAETMLALLGVCLLAVVSLKWLAKRGIGVGPAGAEMIVRERLPLDARRSLLVVEVRGRTFVVGLGESGPPTLLTELEAREIAAGSADRRDTDGAA